MYLIDTDVISESRKGEATNPGVVTFFRSTHVARTPLFLSVITVGELRRGAGGIGRRPGSYLGSAGPRSNDVFPAHDR